MATDFRGKGVTDPGPMPLSGGPAMLGKRRMPPPKKKFDDKKPKAPAGPALLGMRR